MHDEFSLAHYATLLHRSVAPPCPALGPIPVVELDGAWNDLARWGVIDPMHGTLTPAAAEIFEPLTDHTACYWGVVSFYDLAETAPEFPTTTIPGVGNVLRDTPRGHIIAAITLGRVTLACVIGQAMTITSHPLQNTSPEAAVAQLLLGVLNPKQHWRPRAMPAIAVPRAVTSALTMERGSTRLPRDAAGALAAANISPAAAQALVDLSGLRECASAQIVFERNTPTGKTPPIVGNAFGIVFFEDSTMVAITPKGTSDSSWIEFRGANNENVARGIEQIARNHDARHSPQSA